MIKASEIISLGYTKIDRGAFTKLVTDPHGLRYFIELDYREGHAKIKAKIFDGKLTVEANAPLDSDIYDLVESEAHLHRAWKESGSHLRVDVRTGEVDGRGAFMEALAAAAEKSMAREDAARKSGLIP